MSRSIVSRADLLQTFRYGGEDLLRVTAQRLELEDTGSVVVDEQAKVVDVVDEAAPKQQAKADTRGGSWTRFEPARPHYWQLVEYEKVDVPAMESTPSTRQANDKPWRDMPTAVPVIQPLATKQDVLTRLRYATGYRARGTRPDIPGIIDRISNGELLEHIPQKPVRAWGTSLHIIQDRSIRLTPYWSDQDAVCRILMKIYPQYALTISRVWDQQPTPSTIWPPERRGAWYQLPHKTPLLVMGDLGGLVVDEDGREIVSNGWKELGSEAIRNGSLPMALVPCRTDDIPPQLCGDWTTLPWESGRASSSPDALQRLLTLVSPAVRLEPGLLREIRRQVLPGGYGDPGLESRLWQHESLSSRHSVAASFAPAFQAELRKAFDAIPDARVRHDVLNLIRSWRGQLHEAIWFEEILGMGEEARDWFHEDVEDALHMVKQMAVQAKQGSGGSVEWPAFASWARGVLRRIPAGLWRHREIGQALHAISDAVLSEQDIEISPGFQPAQLSHDDGETNVLTIAQRGSTFRLARVADGSPVGTIRTKNGQFRISSQPPKNDDLASAFWKSGRPPAWADRWGTDDVGPWCEIRIADVTQRLRWIPAGQFRMGSPDGEEGRDDDEGPQHDVTISRGFWMFDSPCTQALWEAVMSKNPSEFKGPQQPVENVTWSDCVQFIGQLNSKLSGIDLRIPTEAEWEYACRAGAQQARYGELDEIAWNRANSDSTQDVRQKQQNTWGLFDTLGNVWEWCSDAPYRAYSAAGCTDPLNPATESSMRVVRGGAWDRDARRVRAACRVAVRPESRLPVLGFRCLSSSSPVLPGSVAAESGSVLSVAEQRNRESEPPTRVRSLFSEKRIWTAESEPLQIRTGVDPWFRVESDIEVVSFQRMEVPTWAVESGHDEFGLWANFEFGPASQRLRWVPPGRFKMGSPDDDGSEIERPQHEVFISRGFWLFDTPCTQALWIAVMGKSSSGFENDTRPVERVSWADCQEFCNKMNNGVAGMQVRLPTEAEWEYSCRGGSQTARFGELDDVAWHVGNSRGKTHPVREKLPNSLGIFDMLGNVWEWTDDEWYREYNRESIVDPMHETAEASKRVVRGGGWVSDARLVRAASRSAYRPEGRAHALGFRCLSLK